jgi:hypothetical protein
MVTTSQHPPQDPAATPRPVPTPAENGPERAPAAWVDKFALRVWLACCLLLWAIAASNWLASLWRG